MTLSSLLIYPVSVAFFVPASVDVAVLAQSLGLLSLPYAFTRA